MNGAPARSVCECSLSEANLWGLVCCCLVAGEGLEDNLDVSPEERRYLARLDAGLFPLQRLCHALALLYASTKKVEQQQQQWQQQLLLPMHGLTHTHTPPPPLLHGCTVEELCCEEDEGAGWVLPQGQGDSRW